MKVKEQFNKKLLVEGNDDQHVIWALCEKFQVKENFDVIDSNGIESLYEQLPIRFKQSDIETIGIIIDADAEIAKRWEKVRSILIKEGFTIPEELPAEGLVVTHNNIKVGVWVMPNNNLNGMLEDFISFLVPKDDVLMPIVSETLQSIEDRELNKYSLIHKSKASIHSWLSWQADPGTPMGLAITKKYLTTEEENCSILIKWLVKLFE